jgi:uncharacterized protein (DUF2164 family)
MRRPSTITVPVDAKRRAVTSIRRYFAEQLEQDIGDLKADLLLGYMLEEIGPTIYNQAIADARAFFDERAADLAALCYPAEFPYWDKR